MVDEDALRRELLSYRSEWEDPARRGPLIENLLPRLQAMLALIPPADATSSLLELGASPFLTTVCLDRVWPGSITLASYPLAGAARESERLVNLVGGPDKVYEFDTFNVETDEFPYPDASFDVVLFCELIEHLAINPVWTLSEIHRVLKPNGVVIITTPNAISLERLEALIHGGSESVDRYMPLLGYGARHNREFHAEELRELLRETGFVIEELSVRDLERHPLPVRLRRAARRFLLRWWWRSQHSHRSHLFARARRGDLFRWRFPSRLYDHMGLYRLVRHPWIEMDANDAIQCADGWLPLETCAETGEPVRRIDGTTLESHCLGFAVAYLRGDAGATRLAVRLRSAGDRVRGALRVRSPARGWELLLDHHFTAADGTWVDVVAPLTRRPLDREELEVHVEVLPGSAVLVRRLALET